MDIETTRIIEEAELEILKANKKYKRNYASSHENSMEY